MRRIRARTTTVPSARPLVGRYRVRSLIGIILEVQATTPDLDVWLPDPTIRVTHRRKSKATADQLWQAAEELRLADTRLLGRLIRWRIPGVSAGSSFAELFRNPPFTVLAQEDGSLVSGLVGRIWTLRRDYPHVDPDEFVQWSAGGTAKVVFAHWVESAAPEGSSLHSETRVKALGAQGTLGLASIRPLVRGFEHLVGTDALAAAVRRAERGR
jgi:hypothetical protein